MKKLPTLLRFMVLLLGNAWVFSAHTQNILCQTDWGLSHYVYNLQCDSLQFELYARNDAQEIDCKTDIFFSAIAKVELQKNNLILWLKKALPYPEAHLQRLTECNVRNSTEMLVIPFPNKKEAKYFFRYCITDLKKKGYLQ